MSMQKRIHPNPIVSQVKIILFAILVSILLILARDYLQSIFIQALVIVWIASIGYCAFLAIIEQFISLDIGDSDLIYKKGILSMKTTLIPYSKITDTRFNQTFFERLFGLGTLEVDTAGSDQIAVLVYGIHYLDADEVLKHVRKKPDPE